MSASLLSAAALSRPFIFSSVPVSITEKRTAILAHVGAASKLAAVLPASCLEVRSAPEMVSSGIPQLDALAGGFARGCLTEICGTASSGRTSLLLFALARATQRGEICALVDASDAFDPASAAAAGMEMSRLLWVRCGKKDRLRNQPRQAGGREVKDSYQDMPSGIPPAAKNELGFSDCDSFQGQRPEVRRWETQLAQMLKVTDLLLQSNGFGMIALDLGDVPAQGARRIPLASWFRFRRVIEHTPTVLLVLEQQPLAGSCSSMLIGVSASRVRSEHRSGNRPRQAELPHAELLDKFEITAELVRSRLEHKSEHRSERWLEQRSEQRPERKPVQSIACFNSRAAWAG
jgi:hypothetical protein